MTYTIIQKRRNAEDKSAKSVHQVIYDEETDMIYFDTLRGSCADIRDFLTCLSLGSGIMEKLLLNEFYRKNHPFEITSITGCSGCTDYYVRWQDKQGFIYRKHIFHTSMYGSLNQGVSIWMGDLQAMIFSNEEFYHELIIAAALLEKEEYDEDWQTILEEPIKENKKYGFNTPCDNFMDLWANPKAYNSAHTEEDADNEVEQAEINYPECWAIWKLIGERKGYKKFFQKDVEPEEA